MPNERFDHWLSFSIPVSSQLEILSWTPQAQNPARAWDLTRVARLYVSKLAVCNLFDPPLNFYFSSSFSSVSSANNLARQSDACYRFPMLRICLQRVYCLYLPLPVSPTPNTLLNLLTTVDHRLRLLCWWEVHDLRVSLTAVIFILRNRI